MESITKWAFWLKTLIIIVLILSATFLAYHDALNNDFQKWDTEQYVIQNDQIKAFTWKNIEWMFTTFYMANWHPLTWFSHALDYAWFGLNPWGHHLVSLIIHCLNTVLFFGLMIVLLSLNPLVAKNGLRLMSVNNKTLLAAGIAAIVFGIHPQHVESVVWIAERKDVLCLFFILFTLLFYVFYNATCTTKTRIFWYLSTLLCFVLALLAKPMAVTLPFVLLLMDIYPLKRTHLTGVLHNNRVSYKKLVLEKIPFLVFTLFSIIITLLAQQNSGVVVISGEQGLGIQIRLLNAFNSVIFYVSKFLFPINLSPYYPYPSYKSFHEYFHSLIPVITVFLITLVCGYFWYKKKYYWLVAWLFYLVTLSPVIGIIQVGHQAAADRYVYLPTIPFYILLGIGIVNLLYSKKISKIIKLGIITGCIFLAVVLVQLTQKQTHIWKNNLTFWSYVAAYAPNNALAHSNLGDIYFEMGEYRRAVERYYHVLSLEPPFKWLYVHNLPKAYIKLNQLQEAQKIFNFWIEHNFGAGYKEDEIYYWRGWIYFKQGLLVKAQKSLTKALEINPENNKARKLLLKITSTLN